MNLEDENRRLRNRVEELEEELRQERERSTPEIEWSHLKLTRTERTILAMLYARSPQVLTRRTLTEALDVDGRCVSSHVLKLRKKLPAGCIQTNWGRGYSISAEHKAALTPSFDPTRKAQL